MNHQPNNPIKIALVDDHILLRDSLAGSLERFSEYKVILSVSHGKELIEKLASDNLPHLILLDVNMPEMDGYETAKWMRAHYPDVYILVLTMYDSELAMIRLIQYGVRGFLKKDIHPSELRHAIDTTVQSGYYYSGNSTSKLVNMLKNSEAKVPLVNNIALTDNEMTFLQLASTDMTYKEIARQLKISPRTVDNYRDALFVKLNVKSRVGLVLFAIKNGVIRPGY